MRAWFVTRAVIGRGAQLLNDWLIADILFYQLTGRRNLC